MISKSFRSAVTEILPFTFGVLRKKRLESAMGVPVFRDAVLRYNSSLLTHGAGSCLPLGADSDPLDLLGHTPFRDFLWHCSYHGLLRVSKVKALKPGASVADASYWSISELRRTVFNLSKVELFAAARGFEASDVLNDWAHYLEGLSSHGVFAEYQAFCPAWAFSRVHKCSDDMLFLQLVFGYTRERVEDLICTQQ